MVAVDKVPYGDTVLAAVAALTVAPHQNTVRFLIANYSTTSRLIDPRLKWGIFNMVCYNFTNFQTDRTSFNFSSQVEKLIPSQGGSHFFLPIVKGRP